MNDISRAPLRIRHDPKLRLVQVSGVEQLSPRMRRITLYCDSLLYFTSAAADDHVKLFFPAPGQDRPVLPARGGSGIGSANGAVSAQVRDYTPRWFNPHRRELIIEFVIHGDGPGSSWAAQAAPGQWIGVGGPRGSFLTPDDYDTYLLAGDETALPAIARHLEEARAGARVLALIEVEDAREERHLPTAANAAITWLHRNGHASGTSVLLEQAIRTIELSEGETYAWLAGEIETVRRLRRYMIEERGLSRGQVRAAGYWRVGNAGAHARLDDEPEV